MPNFLHVSLTEHTFSAKCAIHSRRFFARTLSCGTLSCVRSLLASPGVRRGRSMSVVFLCVFKKSHYCSKFSCTCVAYFLTFRCICIAHLPQTPAHLSHTALLSAAYALHICPRPPLICRDDGDHCAAGKQNARSHCDTIW